MVDLTYQSSVEPDALPGRPYPHLPDEAPEAAFGGGIGRGLEDVGEVAQHHYDLAMDQARQTQLTDAHNQLQALSLSLTHDPQTGAFAQQGKNAFGSAPRYLSQYDQQSAQILQGIADPRARAAAMEAAAQVRGNLSEQLDAHEGAQYQKYTVDTANTSVSLAQQAASANYNHPDIVSQNLDHLDATIGSLAQQQGWSDEQRQEALYQAQAKLHEGVLGSMLADNKVDMAKAYYASVADQLHPQEQRDAQHAIGAGEVTASGNSILSAYRINAEQGGQALSALDHSDLTDEQKSEVIEQVERGRSELAIERRAQPAVRSQISALDASIATGNVSPHALDTVESLWRSGAVTDDQRLLYRDQVLRAQKKSDDDASTLNYARTAYANRTPLDPKSSDDRAAADALLQASVRGAPAGGNAFANTAVAITARLGVVPDSAVSSARANLIGGDPKAAAAGAQLLANLQQANPRAYQLATDEGTRAMADTISRAVSAGADPVSAVQLARENAQRSRGEQQQLEQLWNRRYPQAKDSGRLEAHDLVTALSKDPAYEGTGLPFFKPGVPQPPPALTAEFDDLTHQYFGHTGGNLAQAQQLALQDLKGTWAVSSVNGQRSLMKYAPERMFPGLTADMVRDDLASTLKAAPVAVAPELQSLVKEYPGLSGLGIAVRDQSDAGKDWQGNPYDGRELEFHRAGDEDNPNPGHPTLELFSKNVTNKDLLGDVFSHLLPQVNPDFKAARAQFIGSIDAKQKEYLDGDYERDLKAGPTGGVPAGTTFDQWLHGVGGDAFFRGYVAGQYPKDAYRPDQIKLFDGLLSKLRQPNSPAPSSTSPVDPSTVRLVESAETGTSGGRIWNLSTKDQFGAFDVVRDPNGQPLRYQLPDVKKAVSAAEAKQAAADRAKLVIERSRQAEILQAEQYTLDEGAR